MPSQTKPTFTGSCEHNVQISRKGEWVDYASIKTPADMRDAINLVDTDGAFRGTTNAFRIIDKPGMWNSEVVYIKGMVDEQITIAQLFIDIENAVMGWTPNTSGAVQGKQLALDKLEMLRQIVTKS